ncbi:MAG: 3D domain-containing protein [Clostridiales bacterium]|nr:3D domain-containing protein [Clostridiales bacterium]
MYNYLKRIQKTFQMHVPRHISILALCAIIGATLSCTVFLYNALAFFNFNALAYSHVPSDAQAASGDYGIMSASGDSNITPFSQKELAQSSEQKRYKVSIHVDDKVIESVSTGETVENILARSGILVEKPDEVSPSLETNIESDTDITVYRIKNYTEEVLEPIPFETIRRPSEKLSTGESVVAQRGVDGQQKEVVEIYSRDGKETLRYTLKTTVIKNPVPQIIEYGKGGTVNAAGKVYTFKRMLRVTASAYTTENKKWNHTASGTTARFGAIAVDPNIIPMGTKMLITSLDGKSWIYGVAVAEDTGGSIKGNKVDLFFDTRKECINFGVRKAKVYILD